MKKILLCLILCCLGIMAEAQKKKIDVIALQNRVIALEGKADSLARVSLNYKSDLSLLKKQNISLATQLKQQQEEIQYLRSTQDALAKKYDALYQNYLALNKRIDEQQTVSHQNAPQNKLEAVDLGLSVKWASCNLGASRPEEYGDYYAWGELAPKSSYTKSNYTYRNNSAKLPLSADVAHVKLQGKWRMPTKKEIEELTSKCSFRFLTINGAECVVFTSKSNRNSIILPSAGYLEDGGMSAAGRDLLFYWSSTNSEADSDYADILDSQFLGIFPGSPERFCGLPIRPVCDK